MKAVWRTWECEETNKWAGEGGREYVRACAKTMFRGKY